MIKSKLIEVTSRRFPHVTERDIAASVNIIVDELSKVMEQGGRIEIRGFGSFSLHFRPPRKAHNPRTGEKLVTKPKYAAHFKPGKDMRERVNANRHLPIKEVDVKDVD